MTSVEAALPTVSENHRQQQDQGQLGYLVRFSVAAYPGPGYLQSHDVNVLEGSGPGTSEHGSPDGLSDYNLTAVGSKQLIGRGDQLR